MKKKIKIYLCDFVHSCLGVGTYMFPLNIGFIGVYADKLFGDDIEIELFKYPEDFIQHFKANKPDLVGFSNYVWSADLNNKISDWVKKNSPDTIVVYGGPSINYSLVGYQRFFSTHKSADFYVIYQGEIAFANILKKILDKGQDISILKSEPIDGVIFYDKEKDKIIQGDLIPRIKDLNLFPSPYLTGMLDKFFETNLIPIVETNRGCPYRCTYCCQGLSSYNQIDFFDLERVKKELSYIAHKIKNTNILIFADSNFGIAERDTDIARHIAKLTEEVGYPRKVNMNWAKNQPKIFEIAKILKNINLIISVQSLDETVLKNIKRQNIAIPVFQNIVEEVNRAGGISGTEIILALPGETKKSHLESIRKLFDWNVSYITCYNCYILEGSELSLTRESGEFKCKTKFRLIDNAFGEYEGIKSFETEEGIRQLPTISEEDILYFRPIHWLIQFLWNYRFYYDLLKYLQFLQINPLDYIIRLVDNIDNSDTPEKVKEIFREFKEEAKAEWFDSPEALERYYSQPDRFEWLKSGNHGKMNSQYIFKVLSEAREDFETFLYNTAVNYSLITRSKENVIRDLLNSVSATIIDFAKDWQEISKKAFIPFQYDILGWRKSNYQRNLEEFYRPERGKFLLYLPEDQERALKMLLKQYEHRNKNVTLRKMSEYMDIRDCFRKVKII